MPSLHELSLDELRRHAVSTFRRGGGSRADVLLIRVDGRQAVLKDYSGADPWFRRLVGPLSVRREARALAQLEGVPGVPRLIRTIGREALLTEYLGGASTSEKKKNKGLDPEFFARFYRLVEQIHRRGVAHCDLRSEGNILVTPDGDPAFVDFTAHFRRPRRRNPLTRWMFERFCQADRVAVARLKHAVWPELLTEEERAVLARDRKTPLARLARFFGKSIRNISRRLLTKRASR